MRTPPYFYVLAFLGLTLTLSAAEEKWESLFDGKSLEGWRSNEETANAFKVVNGAIKVENGRAHLFYEGNVNGGKFKDFEFRAKIKTTEGSNSGIFFHTKFQGRGWLTKGYECQINSSGLDRRKTGSLYGIIDLLEDSPTSDDYWYDLHIKVQGKKIIIKIDGKQVVEYNEAKDASATKRLGTFKGRVLSEGTFAIQGLDSYGATYLKDIQVKVL